MSYCNEPSQPSKIIVVDRSVFEELVKTAEKGKLANKAVGSFESERRVLRDSLVIVKADNTILSQKIAKDSKFILILFIGNLILIGMLVSVIWLYTR